MGILDFQGREALLGFRRPVTLDIFADNFNLQSDSELPLVPVFSADTGESIHALY